MYKSKRFIAFVVALVLFIILTYTTTYTPLEIAGGLSALTAIYISGESYRKSDMGGTLDV